MKRKVKKFDIFLSVVTILGVSLGLMTFPEETTTLINKVKDSSINVLSPFYQILALGIVLYCLFLCFSKYGDVRLGDKEPEYSTLSWLIMIFCTGMGSNLLYWSALEWIYYYISPPMGAEPGSIQAAELAVTYGGFHWSITGWAIYAVGAVTLGLRYYNLKKPGLTLTASCDGVLKKVTRNRLSERVIELLFLFGSIGGYTTMISFVIPMYCNNLALLFGIENTFLFQVSLILIITLIFTISSWTGLSKGIQKLSKINIVIAILLIGFIILAGPTMFIIKSTTNSLGYMVRNFVQMSLWTDFVGNSGFTETWTSFYWAWWLGLAPSMWIFVTKISQGRKIREILLGMMMTGSLGCWLYFGGISNYGLYQQLTGRIDFVEILTKLGPEQAVAQLVLSLPLGKIVLFIWTLTGIIFLITTMDSGAYILAVSTTLRLRVDETPTKNLRLFWSIFLVILPIGLMRAGAPMGALQASTVVTSIPLGFLTILTLWSGLKYLKNENINKKNRGH